MTISVIEVLKQFLTGMSTSSVSLAIWRGGWPPVCCLSNHGFKVRIIYFLNILANINDTKKLQNELCAT